MYLFIIIIYLFVSSFIFKQVKIAHELLPEIVKRVIYHNGFQYYEFDELYEKSKRDAVFRFRINREIRRMKLNQ